MKNKLSIILSSFLLIGILSCSKKENTIYYEGGTAPSLTASTSIVTLEPGLEANNAVAFQWTNPDYQFTSGISSRDVSYTLEIDTLGGNFKSSNKYVTVISKDLSKTFTVGELNGILGNTMLLQLSPRRNYTLQFRIVSSIGPSVKLTSNVVTITARPFAPPPKVTPPTTGELFIVGSATSGDWNNPVPVPSQKFTKISNTLYEITLPLKGGGSYLFLPLNGDWGVKFGALGSNNTNNPNGDDFKNGGGDLLAPAASGTYKIVVNFQLGKFTVTKV